MMPSRLPIISLPVSRYRVGYDITTVRILLTTTSYQDTSGSHQDLLDSQGWEVVRERGPLTEQEMLALVSE